MDNKYIIYKRCYIVKNPHHETTFSLENIDLEIFKFGNKAEVLKDCIRVYSDKHLLGEIQKNSKTSICLFSFSIEC